LKVPLNLSTTPKADGCKGELKREETPSRDKNSFVSWLQKFVPRSDTITYGSPTTMNSSIKESQTVLAVKFRNKKTLG